MPNSIGMTAADIAYEKAKADRDASMTAAERANVSPSGWHWMYTKEQIARLTQR